VPSGLLPQHKFLAAPVMRRLVRYSSLSSSPVILRAHASAHTPASHRAPRPTQANISDGPSLRVEKSDRYPIDPALPSAVLRLFSLLIKPRINQIRDDSMVHWLVPNDGCTLSCRLLLAAGFGANARVENDRELARFCLQSYFRLCLTVRVLDIDSRLPGRLSPLSISNKFSNPSFSPFSLFSSVFLSPFPFSLFRSFPSPVFPVFPLNPATVTEESRKFFECGTCRSHSRRRLGHLGPENAYESNPERNLILSKSQIIPTSCLLPGRAKI